MSLQDWLDKTTISEQVVRDIWTDAMRQKDNRADELLAKLDASERAAAVMRDALIWLRGLHHLDTELIVIQNALSSDAGRDYVPRSEVDAAWRKGMTDAKCIVEKMFHPSSPGAYQAAIWSAAEAIAAARDAGPKLVT